MISRINSIHHHPLTQSRIAAALVGILIPHAEEHTRTAALERAHGLDLASVIGAGEHAVVAIAGKYNPGAGLGFPAEWS